MVARTYEVLPGFFQQDEGFDGLCAVLPRFGLKDTSNDRWEKLLSEVKKLNEAAPQGVSYKIIIVGRHGQGYHNVAETKYGSQLWNDYWARLEGDGEIIWGPDPLLTPLGEAQALDAHEMWKEERSNGMPLPDAIYCSPLTRALKTCEITFSDVVDFKERRPLILENLREIYGLNTCDKRKTLSYIKSTFPEFAVEEGFSENDPWFDPEVREEEEHLAGRSKKALDYIFEHEDGILISVTAHGGIVRGLQKATHHVQVILQTGGVLPMVVKSILTN